MQGETSRALLYRLGARTGREKIAVGVFQPLSQHLVEGWKQVSVPVQGQNDRRMSESFLDGFWGCSYRYRQ